MLNKKAGLVIKREDASSCSWHTDNFSKDYQNLLDQQIKIVRDPVVEPYGTVCVFADLYGNLWDLIEPSMSSPSI
jgi:hypothetical protein